MATQQHSQCRILLGVSGSIAAYKSAELIRLLRAEGATVRVIMTRAAQKFITPLTLQTLAGTSVYTDMFQTDHESDLDHIKLARWADRIVIAPASAHSLARLAYGFADDLLTTVALASAAPLFIAPAMNQQMWHHPATQANVERLQQHGVTFLGPERGDQACGEQGFGRLQALQQIVTTVLKPTEPAAARRLTGVNVLITAGPTREALDPVRFLSNRSSGKMGYALASAFADLGAQVSLVTGPTALTVPPGMASVQQVQSALDMYDAVMACVDTMQIVIAAAAVADYRPLHFAPTKLKKQAQPFTLTLVPNPDIITAVTSRPQRPLTVGFAAETDQLEYHARLKLQAKQLDLIAANDVGGASGGFECDDNALVLLWADQGRCVLPLMPKTQLAREFAQIIADHYVTHLASQTT
jgi:phosphopantothenoylcysteine decarboxylase/phosphopantothenate--cysteine ligase